MNLRIVWMLLASMLGYKIQMSMSIALAPVTLGEVVYGASHLSNTLRATTAWKILTDHGSPLKPFIKKFPSRAMNAVQNVFDTLRREGRILLVTGHGALKGRVQPLKSGLSGTYYSFKGIRYGQAPTGARRFRSALPEHSWKGIRNALREGPSCPQRNMLLDNYKGSEDCLYLNVYTPKMPDENGHPRLPVMFWIHGGAFSFGSGNAFLYGPDFFMTENVILVTINYRMGPLGFLSVGGDGTGNAGLKDQVLALKWVQKNIAAFGGDPNQVTIFGQSAGGASVEYLTLSPMAAGLFHRAIIQSGSVLNPWAFAREPRERAFTLGRKLGLHTNDTKELLTFLRKVTPQALVDAASQTLTPEDARNNIGIPFVPSVEESWVSPGWEGSLADLREEPFLVEDPMSLLERGAFNKVPMMSGFVTHEAMLFIRRLRKDPTLLKTIDNDKIRLVPIDLNITDGRDSDEGAFVAKQIQRFYMGPRVIGDDTKEELVYLFTDEMFFHGILNSARFHAANSTAPVFFYRFAFDGALGLYKRLLGINRPGVCHGDELGYLFHFGVFNLSLDPDSIELRVKQRMVKMWSNFAKYGNPTPMGRDDVSLGVNWEPINGNDTKYVPYMDITAQLQSKVNPEAERLLFWDDLYTKYNNRFY